jgi:hypothetical protein
MVLEPCQKIHPQPAFGDGGHRDDDLANGTRAGPFGRRDNQQTYTLNRPTLCVGKGLSDDLITGTDGQHDGTIVDRGTEGWILSQAPCRKNLWAVFAAPDAVDIGGRQWL